MSGIVLVRTDRIGDLILSTPAIATVRRSFPDERITMVCSSYNRVVMERNTDVDEIVDLPGDVKPEVFGSRFRGRARLAIALAPRTADLAIVGGTRAPVRVGYTYLRRYLLRFTLRRYVNRLMISEADPDLSDRDPHRYVRHEVDQLLDLVALAGANERVESLRLDVNDEDRSAIEFLPSDPIVFHLGKRWFHDGSTLESTLDADPRAAPFRSSDCRDVRARLRAIPGVAHRNASGRRAAWRASVLSLGRGLRASSRGYNG